ncbi:MAG: MMPL family transporter [Candidatus Thermoplasmatota archaeon]|nr:MMPL family transporter [Candidatus Thermoplasmatota archaeon]
MAENDDGSGSGPYRGRTGGRPGREGPPYKVDETLDRVVSDIGDRTPEYRSRARKFIKDARRRLEDLDDRGEEYTQRMFRAKPADALMEGILKYRVLSFILIILIGLSLGYFGVIGNDYIGSDDEDRLIAMQSKIRGDFEVYLPGGSDAEKVLAEVKIDWSTDLATLMIETQNKFDPTDETNITDYNVLIEMSRIEEALNPQKEDRGSNDGINYVFSISTIIKTLHNLTNATSQAVIGNIPYNIEFDAQDGSFIGNYSIPTDQRMIDELFYRIPPNQLNALVADINNDGIYDSALIMLGLSKSIDERTLLKRINSLIEPYFVDTGVRPGSQDTTGEWLERYNNGDVNSRMTLTGPTPLARMISDRTMSEMKTVLPWAMVMVCASLLIFHRTWKIWIITMAPVTVSLIMTYGLLGLAMDVLTPQVVLVAPILIALGVAYGLYIANRYSEEISIKDKELRIRAAIRTTGKAIFLSAMTTAFGFGSMLTVDLATMQVLGFGLSTGILFCYLTTMIMTPSLVIWLNYTKESGKRSGGSKPRSRKMGDIPLNHSRKIILGGMVLAIISISLAPAFDIPGTGAKIGGMGMVKANMDYIKLSPQDEPVVQKMREQSDTFGSGQIGLLIIRGQPTKDTNADGIDDFVDNSIKDISLLHDLETLGNRTNGPDGVEMAQSISIVDIMMMVNVPDFTNSTWYKSFLDVIRNAPGLIIEDPERMIDEWVRSNVIGKSFWDAINTVPDDNAAIKLLLGVEPSLFLINVFYDSMGVELRSMLINDDYSKTLAYINMPNMDIIETEVAVNEMDDVIDGIFDVQVKESAGSKTTASPLTGFGKVLVTINNLLVANANQSTIIAILLVFLLLSLVLKSWRIALVTVIPVTFVVFWQYFAIWGVASIEDIIRPGQNMFSGDLNLFTALIGSIIVGTGVDFSIHITERVRERGLSLEGVRYAAETSGWTFIEATTTMIMGLTAVFLVNIPSIREFILLIMILLAFSAYAAIFILTSIYRLYLPRYNKLRALKKIN